MKADGGEEAGTGPVGREAICYETGNFLLFKANMDQVFLPASICASFLNMLVIFYAFRLLRGSGDATHMFIMNMALGDLLLTLLAYPNEFLIRENGPIFRENLLCQFTHFSNWLGLAVSALSLTLLNSDKLLYFRCERAISKLVALLLCLAVWALSFSFVAFLWLRGIVYVGDKCILKMVEHGKFYYEIFVILFSILPVLSSLALSLYLFRHIHTMKAPQQQQNMATFKDKLKSLVFIFATTAWTSFSLLPYRIFNICRIHLFDWASMDCEQLVLIKWMAWILLYLLALNSIVNPLITLLLYGPYRLHLKRLFWAIPALPRSIYSRTGDSVTENMHSHISIRKFRKRGETLERMATAAAAGTQSPVPLVQLGKMS